MKKKKDDLSVPSMLKLRYSLVAYFGIESALIFAYLESQRDRIKKSGKLTEEGYFYRSLDTITSACYEPYEHTERNLRCLIRNGVIKSKTFNKDGVDVEHFMLDIPHINSFDFDWEEQRQETENFHIERRLNFIRMKNQEQEPVCAPPPRESKTYIMFDGHTKLFKIGKSFNPTARERTLCGEVPKIKLLFIKERDIESHLHTKYSHKRHRGEWFKLSLEEVVKIADDYGFEAVY